MRDDSMFEIETAPSGFELYLDHKLLIRHTDDRPALFLGRAQESISMYRGNFSVSDRVLSREAPRFVFAQRTDDSARLCFELSGGGEFYVLLCLQDGLLRLETDGAEGLNRLWLLLYAEEDEHVSGGGEQFSCLDLRGRSFPIWTREQGVGRNKATEVTRLADESDGGGGDYHTTFYPQPTFVSSRYYFAHLDNYEYSELDFTAADRHCIHVWSTRTSFVFGSGGSYAEVLLLLTDLLGRQPPLPEWAVKGLWLGVQGGTDAVRSIEEKCLRGGMDISAVWIQDWEGRRVTSFGKRLCWDWRWNRELYPGLDALIAADAQEGRRWMGYINPYLVKGGILFARAEEKGYFVKTADGSDYLFDFGEFDCGVVDLTFPDAFEWYKGVIRENLIGLGFKGWMADFGEYLPADCVCFGGSGLELHNKWPLLWAMCCREAVRDAGMEGEIVFFMRAGAARCGAYSTLAWAGDQCVDWTADDGLPSVITAALSLGMSGMGLHTSDAGGYTTLFHLKRTRELLLRWLEFSCFTPVMRTHEGNRPDSNAQLYSDDETIRAAARLTRIHTALAPYIADCMAENARTGMPVMRPLFICCPDSAQAYDRDLFEYLLGGDMLAAPVVREGETRRRAWLPDGEWIHLWSGRSFSGGWCDVDAPMGQPPVFYRPDSARSHLFRALPTCAPQDR